MVYLGRDASRAQIRKAENARRNRAEIVNALSIGDVTRLTEQKPTNLKPVTVSRTKFAVCPSERLARKDVWWLGKGGSVTVQVRFGEYGGAFVTHWHNTVHADAAMLLRCDILTNPNNPKNAQTHVQVVPTPNPTPNPTPDGVTPDGVTHVMPEILPEGNPFHPTFNPKPAF